jgi:hypothetical protein
MRTHLGELSRGRQARRGARGVYTERRAKDLAEDGKCVVTISRRGHVHAAPARDENALLLAAEIGEHEQERGPRDKWAEERVRCLRAGELARRTEAVREGLLSDHADNVWRGQEGHVLSGEHVLSRRLAPSECGRRPARESAHHGHDTLVGECLRDFVDVRLRDETEGRPRPATILSREMPISRGRCSRVVNLFFPFLAYPVDYSPVEEQPEDLRRIKYSTVTRAGPSDYGVNTADRAWLRP